MGTIARQNVPRIVIQGETQTLDMDIYDSGSNQLTVSSGGTITIRLNGILVVDAQAVVAGAPATYVLADTATADLGRGDRWLEKWTLTTSEGTETYTRRGHLALTGFVPTVVDQDLFDMHSEIEGQLAALNLASLQKYRDNAQGHIERDLLKQGRRSELIFDSWALFDAHRFKSWELGFRDFGSILGQGIYKDLADFYAEKYDLEMANIVFSYDESQNGTLNDSDKESAQGPITLTSGRRNAGYWSRFGGIY